MTGQALGMLILDFVIVFAVLLCARVLYGLVAGIDVTEEMAGKNNHAVGISLAGATAGIGIMLSGVVTGTFSSTLGTEALSMVVYAAVGLVLMWLTRLIFDKVSLPSFSVKDEIARGNNAVAIVDAGNMVATAVMVRAVMNWSEGTLSSGLIAVAVGYVATQIILTLTTVYRVKLFRMRNREGAGFQDVVRARQHGGRDALRRLSGRRGAGRDRRLGCRGLSGRQRPDRPGPDLGWRGRSSWR